MKKLVLLLSIPLVFLFGCEKDNRPVNTSHSNTQSNSNNNIELNTDNCDYDGPDVVEFTKENGADWNLSQNRDIITPTCEITRQANQPLYNYVYQSGFNDNQEDSNIAWKRGEFDSQCGWFSSIAAAFDYAMPQVLEDVAILHVMDSDLYFELEFHSWTIGYDYDDYGYGGSVEFENAGGFSYTRTFLGCGAPSQTCGCADDSACNFNPLATADDGSCLYEGDLFYDYETYVSMVFNENCELEEIVYGCTNPAGCNYDPYANYDYGYYCDMPGDICGFDVSIEDYCLFDENCECDC